jgi:hypothetical protein
MAKVTGKLLATWQVNYNFRKKKLGKSTVRQSSGQLQNEGSKRGTHAFDLSLGSQN